MTAPLPLDSTSISGPPRGGTSAFIGLDVPSPVDLSRCVHCGLCLMNCPTFVATGLETESPRGRLYLMRAADEGRVPINDSFVGHMELCLQCRNCESVCPSGVPFGRIMERTRAQILTQGKGSGAGRRIRKHALRALLMHKRLLKLAAGAMSLYQHAGPQRGLRSPLARRLLPASLLALEAAAPNVSARPFRPKATLFRAHGPRRHSVALFSGCVMPYMYPGTEWSTVQVLRRNGCDVVIPKAQRCCGALLTHNGDREAARTLARDNIDLFAAAGVDAVIINAAGCGSTLKDYGELLEHDAGYAERARSFQAMVRDATEFLAAHDLDTAALGSVPARVTYQDSCHLAHAQRIKESPRALLRAIPGLTLVELATDRCCGSAGIYNVTQRAVSMEVLAGKLDEIADAGPEIVVSANPGCMMQVEGGMRRRGMSAPVMHVVDLLERAYRAGERRG